MTESPVPSSRGAASVAELVATTQTYFPASCSSSDVSALDTVRFPVPGPGMPPWPRPSPSGKPARSPPKGIEEPAVPPTDGGVAPRAAASEPRGAAPRSSRLRSRVPRRRWLRCGRSPWFVSSRQQGRSGSPSWPGHRLPTPPPAAETGYEHHDGRQGKHPGTDQRRAQPWIPHRRATQEDVRRHHRRCRHPSQEETAKVPTTFTNRSHTGLSKVQKSLAPRP